MKGEWRMNEGWMKDEWRMNEGWMKDKWEMMKDEGWMMKDEGLKLLRGFASRLTDERTDIGECRVAFAPEWKPVYLQTLVKKEGGWSKQFQKYLDLYIFYNRVGVSIHLNPDNLTDFRVIIEKISFHYVFFINRQIREGAPPFAPEQLIFSF